MLIRTPIYPGDHKCNNKNIHEYSPYIVTDNENIIDKEWWNSLTSYCQQLIQNRTNNNFILKDIDIPHDFQFDNKDKFLTTIYRCYIDSFDYNIWYPYLIDANIPNTPSDVILIPINKECKRIFVEFYNNTNQYDSPYINELKQCLFDNIEENKEYFVRLSGTSGKNEKSVRPFSNVDDIISHISSVKLFVDQEYRREEKDTCLILIPWNTCIDARYEFRIFVVNGKLTGISQQYSDELYQYSGDELDSIIHAITNIPFLNNLCYKTFIGDVYVDINDKVCYLIELNPFGAHCGAGSALFNWIEDFDILHGATDISPEFRYLSIINY